MRFDAFADFRMTGQSAIVTGGAQNIGAAIARTFAGAKVMIADLDGDKADATPAEIHRNSQGQRDRGGVTEYRPSPLPHHRTCGFPHPPPVPA